MRNAGRLRGFTLLEVLVSLAILSATLVLAFQVISGAIAAQERSEGWTRAICLGEEKMREVLPEFPEVQETEGTFPEPNEVYSWKLTVRQALHEDAREVHVEVAWGPPGGRETLTVSGISSK